MELKIFHIMGVFLACLAAAGPAFAASVEERKAFISEMAEGLKQAPDKPTRTEGLDQCYRVHNRATVEARPIGVNQITELAIYAAVSDCVVLMFALGRTELSSRYGDACRFLGELKNHMEAVAAVQPTDVLADAQRYAASAGKSYQDLGCGVLAGVTGGETPLQDQLQTEIEAAQFAMFSDPAQAAARCNAAYTSLAVGSGRTVTAMTRSTLSAQAAMCVASSIQLGGTPPATMLTGICEAAQAGIWHYDELMPLGGKVAEQAGPLRKIAEDMLRNHHCPAR